MLLYKITYQTKVSKEDHVALHKQWEGSKAAASKFRSWARQRHGYIPSSVQTEHIDVPTKKDGLLKFLNSDMML